jgi:acyl-CoA thioesterase FadM
VLEVDDEVVATAEPADPGWFTVRLRVQRGGAVVTVLRGRIRVVLVGSGAAGLPPWLSPFVVDRIPVVPAGPTPATFGWDWTVRYPDCHFSDRVQHGAYVRVLEETVDRFLVDRSISVPRLLAERGWIPVVSRARLRLLGDARMDDVVRASFSVSDILKNRMFDGRMDCHVIGSGPPRPVATATILHGYAVSVGAGAGTVAELDEATVKALLAEVGP